METKVIARIKELEKLITQERHRYYNNEPGGISDDDYDLYVEELASLKSDSYAITAVGSPAVSSWSKVSHAIPMGSLDKVQTVEDMSTWIRKNSRDLRRKAVPFEELLILDKLDGISISVTYKNGYLRQALTRGDGIVGEDITVNVAKMRGIPKEISVKGMVELRGEIVLLKDNLSKFPGATDTRMTASGTAKRYDGFGCENLDVFFYRVESAPVDFEKHSDQIEWLETLGFQIPSWYVTVQAPGARTPQDIWVEYQTSIREGLPYNIDGLVVSLNDLAYQISLGEVNGRPNGAIAFKFPPVTRETAVLNIEWQVGSSGHLTPVAVVKPVRLFGAEVQRASLYNYEYIQKIGLYVGARVLITRSNDVIPRVVSVLSDKKDPASFAETCPECGTATVWEGKFLNCPNTVSCPAQIEGRIKLWIKKLGILEWGDVLTSKVTSSGLVTSVPDLYRLKERDIASLEGMGEASAKKALANLRSVLPLTFEDMIGSLGVPLCGRSTMELVALSGIDSFQKLSTTAFSTLQDIQGMGPKRARALLDWAGKAGPLIEDMASVGITLREKPQGVLLGKSVCFTGATKRKRSELEKLVLEAGGSVKTSVGKGLTFLVMADLNSGSAKAKAAAKNGTQCISEDTLLGDILGIS